MADIDNNTTGGDDNIELEEITQIEDEETEGTEETNLGGTDKRQELIDVYQEQMELHKRLRDPNVSIVVPQGFNPDVETEQKKDFLKDYLNISVDESDGTNSAKLIKHTKNALEKRVK